MTHPDYTDEWERYWQTVHDGSNRLLVENAARDPDRYWLVADVQILDEEFDVEPTAVHERPDDVVEAARAGFGRFVDASLDVGPDCPEYDSLPVHFVGLDRVPGSPFEFEECVRNANELIQLRNAHVTGDVDRYYRTTHVTYRCPQGHETTIRQPRHRTWTLSTCGTRDCSNEVVVDDGGTRARRVVDFTFEFEGDIIQCTATGRIAEKTSHLDRLRASDRLLVGGIPRLVSEADGTVRTVLEVVHVEPT